jgi:hypothetical protein
LINQYPVGSFILWATSKNIDARTLNGEKLPKKSDYMLGLWRAQALATSTAESKEEFIVQALS